MARGMSVALLLACLAVVAVECQFPFFGGRGFFRRPAPRPVFRQPPPPQARPQARPQASRSGCPTSSPNHNWQGKGYVLSWLNGPAAACGKFTGGGARSYCSSMGMKPISLDNSAKANHFIDVLRTAPTTYFWTGGNVDHGRRQVCWANNACQNFNEIGYWSTTGGLNRAQPDNREGGETCLGVLNGVYNDGITFHDIRCSHRKPVICE